MQKRFWLLLVLLLIYTNNVIASDSFHTCALMANNSLKCWGYNAFGLLGDGTTTDSYTPLNVNDSSIFVAVSTSREQSCGLLSNGSIKC